MSGQSNKFKLFTELNVINIHKKFPATNPNGYRKTEYSPWQKKTTKQTQVKIVGGGIHKGRMSWKKRQLLNEKYSKHHIEVFEKAESLEENNLE